MDPERRRLLELIRQGRQQREYVVPDNPRLQPNFGNTLHVLLLPLNHIHRHVYLDNITEIAESGVGLDRLVVEGYRDENLDRLCPEIADVVREAKTYYPTEFEMPRMSRSQKGTYWGLIVANFLPEGVPVAGKVAGFAREWLAIGGLVIGGTLGYALGSGSGEPGSEIAGAIGGGLVGGILGYLSMALYGGYRLTSHGISNLRERGSMRRKAERNRRIRDNIDRLADQIYYQEVPVQTRMLRDFWQDNLHIYINDRWEEPRSRITQERVYRGFRQLLELRETLNQLTYSLRRYYRRKVHDYEVIR